MSVKKSLVLLVLIFTSSATFSETCSYGLPYVGPKTLEPLNSRDVYASKPDFQRTVSSGLAASLEQNFDEMFNLTDASAASVSLYSPEHGYWSSSKGADAKPFWLANIGKLATAIVITQLMEEKQLLPEDPIDRWFPEIPDSQLITIDQLLRHTSGLHHLNDIESIQNEAGQNPSSDLLKASIAKGLDFCPGTNWKYSNTGYLVLAKIAEKLDERSYAEIIQHRISNPLKLQSFRVTEHGSDLSGVTMPQTRQGTAFITKLARRQGAGSIVSTTNDAIILLSAYLRGEMVSDSSIADSFVSLYPQLDSSSSYGRGIMVTQIPDIEHPTTWVGHSGEASDGKALLIFDLVRKTYLAITLNTQAPADAIAASLLKQLD